MDEIGADGVVDASPELGLWGVVLLSGHCDGVRFIIIIIITERYKSKQYVTLKNSFFFFYYY